MTRPSQGRLQARSPRLILYRYIPPEGLLVACHSASKLQYNCEPTLVIKRILLNNVDPRCLELQHSEAGELCRRVRG
jgi:hypothetical protein